MFFIFSKLVKINYPGGQAEQFAALMIVLNENGKVVQYALTNTVGLTECVELFQHVANNNTIKLVMSGKI
jgi:hypothetical protein